MFHTARTALYLLFVNTVVYSFCITTGSVAFFVYKPLCIFYSLSNKVHLFNRLWAPAITELLLEFTALETLNSNT